MKQRKPPYVLGGILFVALCAIVFIGFKFAKDAGANSEDAPPPASQPVPPTIGESRPAPSPETVSEKVKIGAELSSSKTARRPKKPMPFGPQQSDEPSVVIPKQEERKPSPNDTSTTSHWW